MLLLVVNRLQPVPNTSVLPFLNGDVRHGRAWRPIVAMLLAGRYPDDVSRTYVFDWAAPSLHAAYSRRHDQRLGVPIRRGSRLKLYATSCNTCWLGSLKQRVNPYRASELCCSLG